MEAEMCIVIGIKGEFYEHSPFEKEMATYPSIPAGKSHGQRSLEDTVCGATKALDRT